MIRPSAEKQAHFLGIVIPLAVLFVILLLLMPKAPQFDYDYKKGDTWKYETLISEFDFPILKTEEELIRERENQTRSAVPYYTVQEDVQEQVLSRVEQVRDLPDFLSRERLRTLFEDLYSVGILPENAPKLDGEKPYTLSDQLLCVVRGKKEQSLPRSGVYSLSLARERLQEDLRMDGQGADTTGFVASLLRLMQANLVFDPQLTDLAYTESPNTLSPTSGYRNAQEILVNAGETITAEIQQVLDSYREEYDRKIGFSGSRGLLWLGNGIIALAIVMLIYLSILFTNPLIFEDRNRFLYLLTVILISTLVVFAVNNIGSRYLYMVPFTLIALYLVAFFRYSVVFPIYTISLLPLLIFSHNGIELFMMYLSAGAVTMLIFKRFNRGWRQFITAAVVFAVLSVIYIGFRVTQSSSQSIPVTILYLALASFLSVAGYPMIYLFEMVFNLVSNSRLEELCDTNNRALRDLAAKAPGTFQHCLQVMNMADAATRSIGGNVLLVRAGALYHDIGKMVNPLCFIENEGMAPAGEKFHTGLTPKESAAQIIRHVRDGEALADRYHLPRVVTDFIRTHHGTSSTGYFYNQYLNQGGDPSDADEFFYPGPRPKTREQCILMLCDTIEAASRTLRATTPEAFSDFVDRMCAAKVEAGQLDECEISLQELNQVKSTLKEYLMGVYHQRIVYPKRKGETARLDKSK